MESDEKLLLLAALLLKKRKKRTRRWWVREIFKKRSEQGYFNNLIAEMRFGDREMFMNFFRMSPELFDELLAIVGPSIQKKESFFRSPVSASKRLSLTLRFLASGDSMISLSYSFRLGKSTVSTIIQEVCSSIWDTLCPIYLKPPNRARYKQIALEFGKIWHFPNCIGALDGKHIVIQAPNKSGAQFFNHKSSFSIVLLAVCDADYRFTVVDIGGAGRQSDGGVFSNSEFGKSLQNGSLGVPDDSPVPPGSSNMFPYVFVADEAFPLKHNLMRPYPKRSLTLEKRIFNYRLSRARRIIENTFGIMVSRFRIFRKPIIAKIDTVEKIVKATVCLHNFLRSPADTFCTKSLIDFEDENGVLHPGSWRNTIHAGVKNLQQVGSNMYARKAAETRVKFLHYFNNEGAVPWQLSPPLIKF